MRLTGRRSGGSGEMSLPSRRIRPSVGSSNPASIRSSVVFPQPDGPSSAKNWLRMTSRLTPSTARTRPKVLTTPSILRIGASFVGHAGHGVGSRFRR